MGCDSHCHLEIKVGGTWLHYSAPRVHRNYELFEKMAGVRGEERKAIAPPRGIPGDASDVTKLEAKWLGSDCHSHSWLSANELAEIIKFQEKQYGNDFWKVSHQEWGYLNGNGWDGFLKYRDSYPKEIEDIRLVFWFDN